MQHKINIKLNTNDVNNQMVFSDFRTIFGTVAKTVDYFETYDQ